MNRSLRFLAPLALVVAALFAPHAARAACGVSMPYVFVNSVSTVDATTTNTNNTFLLGCANSVDNTQIGPAGIYASQIKPTSGANATFGGSQTYTFPLLVVFTSGIQYGVGATLNTSNSGHCGLANAKSMWVQNAAAVDAFAVDAAGDAGACGTVGGSSFNATNLAGGGAQVACLNNGGQILPCYISSVPTFNFPAHGIAYLVNATDGCGSLGAAPCATMSANCTNTNDCGSVTITGNVGACVTPFLAQFAIAGVGTSPTSPGWMTQISINGSTVKVHFFNFTGSTFNNVTTNGLAAGFTCSA